MGPGNVVDSVRYGRIVEAVRIDLLDEFLKVRDITRVPYF